LALINYPEKDLKQEARVEYFKPATNVNEEDHQEPVDYDIAEEDLESDGSSTDDESTYFTLNEETEVSTFPPEEEDEDGVMASEDDTIAGIIPDAVESYGLETHTRKEGRHCMSMFCGEYDMQKVPSGIHLFL